MNEKPNKESILMKLTEGVGLGALSWSLRRLHVPVPKNALVLEVGSGGNPYPRSNVLLDAYEEGQERAPWDSKLVCDRPLVLGLIEQLPFKNKAFDFVIASHVLEHSENPREFLTELMRVGKAGYIETPDAFFERINPYKAHRLEVTDKNNQLIIRKKTSWLPDGEMVDLYENKLKGNIFFNFIKAHPRPFFMRHYWIDKIEYQIINDGVDASWPVELSSNRVLETSIWNRSPLRKLFLKISRRLLAQNSRNKLIDIRSLLRCPDCGDEMSLQFNDDKAVCGKCSSEFLRDNGIWKFYPKVNSSNPSLTSSHA